MKSTLKHLLVALSLLLLLIACSKMDHTYSEFLQGGEKVYSVKPKRIQFFPGDNRIKVNIALVSAPNLEKLRIFWNARNDSIEWKIEPDINRDSIFVEGIIDPINEGRHTFEFVTFDRGGNHSIKMDTVGVVYGDDYANTLINREMKSAVMDLESGYMKIEWLDAPESIIGSEGGGAIRGEVFYENMEGKTIRVNVPLDEFETRIGDRSINDSIRFRMVYLPELGAIDTFYSKSRSVLLTHPPKPLDKSKFKPVILPTDGPPFSDDYDMNVIWDDDLTTWWGTADQAGEPHWFTFDLGVKAKLAEYTIWQRGVIDALDLVYAHANMKKWELWGSNNPDPDGGWENWIPLLINESYKPSGLPFGQVAEEDYEYAEKGDTFTFPSTTPAVRYIRIKVLETWQASRSHRSFLGEVSFKGSVE